MNNINNSNDEELTDEKPLPLLMVLACYAVALILVISIVYGFTGIIADIITNTISKKVSRMDILSSISVFYVIYKLMRVIGDNFRSNPNYEIGTAVINLPNPFYDPGFKKGPLLLQREYRTY
ncbi:MAG: hypothetical protein AB2392_19650 [Neobacillus sp.]